MAKRVNLISNLSNLRRERHLEALYSSSTCFQIISVAEERLSTFHINLKSNDVWPMGLIVFATKLLLARIANNP